MSQFNYASCLAEESVKVQLLRFKYKTLLVCSSLVLVMTIPVANLRLFTSTARADDSSSPGGAGSAGAHSATGDAGASSDGNNVGDKGGGADGDGSQSANAAATATAGQQSANTSAANAATSTIGGAGSAAAHSSTSVSGAQSTSTHGDSSASSTMGGAGSAAAHGDSLGGTQAGSDPGGYGSVGSVGSVGPGGAGSAAAESVGTRAANPAEVAGAMNDAADSTAQPPSAVSVTPNTLTTGMYVSWAALHDPTPVNPNAQLNVSINQYGPQNVPGAIVASNPDDAMNQAIVGFAVQPTVLNGINAIAQTIAPHPAY